MVPPCAEWWCETENRATTSFGYCSSTASLPVRPDCANARWIRCQTYPPWRNGGDHQDAPVLRGWGLPSRTWNHWMKQLKAIVHSGEWCLCLVLCTHSGAHQKWINVVVWDKKNWEMFKNNMCIVPTANRKRLKVKWYSCSEKSSQSYGASSGVTFHVESHSVTCHPTQVNAAHLTLARRAGTQLTWTLEGWKATSTNIPSVNRARCRATLLIKTNLLATTPCCHLSSSAETAILTMSGNQK